MATKTGVYGGQARGREEAKIGDANSEIRELKLPLTENHSGWLARDSSFFSLASECTDMLFIC